MFMFLGSIYFVIITSKKYNQFQVLKSFDTLNNIFGGNGKWLMMENGFWSVKNDKYFYHRGLHWFVKLSIPFSHL